ncbi:uncharacterized protein CBL_09705 [Carabus blaptoides fortunei]
MSVTWTYESVKCLITLWEEQECLYKTDNPGYRNKRTRSRALHNIYQQMVSAGFKKWTEEDINKKMRGLRTQYLAEKNKIKASKVNGAGDADVYKPKLWSYNLLEFLKPASINILDDMQPNEEYDGYNSDNMSGGGVNVSSNWSQEYTRYFIELWAQHPLLNTANARDTTNKLHKQKAMEEIVRDLNAMGDVKFTVNDIRKKIHGLKTQYQKERSLIQQSIDNGATGDEVYVPKLWTYNLLHFICDNERAVSEYKNQTIQATCSRISDKLAIDPLDISSLSSNSISNLVLSNNQVIENVRVKTPEPIVEVLPHQMQLDDDVSAFANVLLYEMRQLKTKSILRKFKRDVMNLIYSAQEKEDDQSSAH